MEIGSVSSSSPSTAQEVKVATNERHQQEAVVTKILSGIESATRAPEQTGQRLNVAA